MDVSNNTESIRSGKELTARPSHIVWLSVQKHHHSRCSLQLQVAIGIALFEFKSRSKNIVTPNLRGWRGWLPRSILFETVFYQG